MDTPWNSPGQNIGVGSLSLLQGIFPTQGLNPDFSHCRQILYQLSYQGNPRILEWAPYPLLQGIFLTQESNQGLLHCRWILYQLSCQGMLPKFSLQKLYQFTYLPAMYDAASMLFSLQSALLPGRPL